MRLHQMTTRASRLPILISKAWRGISLSLKPQYTFIPMLGSVLRADLCLLTPRKDEVVIIDGSVFFAGDRGLGVVAATHAKAGSKFTASDGFEASPSGADGPAAATGALVGEDSSLTLGRSLGADAQACD